MSLLSDSEINDSINEIISKIYNYGLDYDSRTDDSFPLKNTRIRFICRNEDHFDKKYLEIMIGRFIISRVWNNRIEFSLPLPINDYFRVSINNFIMKSSIRLINHSRTLEIKTDILKRVYNKKKSKNIEIEICLGDHVLLKNHITVSDNSIFGNNPETKYSELEVNYDNNIDVTYLFPSRKNRSVSIYAKLYLLDINNNNISNNNNINDKLKYKNYDDKNNKICGLITMSNAACLSQLSKFMDDNDHIKQNFDYISTNCYLKEDIELYLDFINKIAKKCLGNDMMWELTQLEIPNNKIQYKIIKEGKEKTITEKQKVIYWIRPTNEVNKYRFAKFQRSIGFQTKGLWQNVESIIINDKEDLWEVVDLDGDNEVLKKKIDKSSLGPHTAMEGQIYENQKIEKAKEHAKSVNCQNLTKLKSLFFG